MYKVIGIAGSLRKDSINKALLKALVKQARGILEIEVVDLAGIPLYNGDLEAENFPEAVAELKQKIDLSDGVLIVTPEYNWSTPGVVKNMIDWVSRPYAQSKWVKKPVAITGATGSWQGTVRAQTQLKGILQMMQAYVMPTPELLISHFLDHFEADGAVKDEETEHKLINFIQGFSDWIAHFK